MKLKTDHVLTAFFLTCGAIGLMAGFVGLGVGLIMLPVSQAIGVGMLSFGLGAFLGATFGGGLIMRTAVKTIREMYERGEFGKGGE